MKIDRKDRRRVKYPYLYGFFTGLAAPTLLFTYMPLDSTRHQPRDFSGQWKDVGKALRTGLKEFERERQKATAE